jgi:glyoxylate reductase
VATVFVSGALPGGVTEWLAERHDVVQADAGVASDAFCLDAARFDGLVALLTDRVDASLLARAPRLRVVGNVAVGVDNVDLDACRARGVVVTNTPDVLTEATADLTFALLLGAARRVGEGDRTVRAGAFGGWTPTYMLGKRVHGATLGVLGLGRIGRAVARRARGFSMNVLYTQRSPAPRAVEEELGARFVDLAGLLAQSDFVSVHCPLSPQTRHLLDRERLASMRRGAVLVNTARGPIVDEAALADALASGHLAAAGLDVFEDEPRVHAGLVAAPSALMTPHIGSADGQTREAMARLAAENVDLVLSGARPKTPV